MKVFVYVRPRIDKFFHALSKNINAFSEVIYISDHKEMGGLWIMEYFYKAKKDILSGEIAPRTSLNIERISNRCRYLRQLNTVESSLRIRAMALGLERMVDENDISYTFGMVMDSYVLDILDLVLREKGGQYIGFLNNMINGYSRLTARGELMHLAEVDNSKSKLILQDLERKNYVPNMQNDFMWNTNPFVMFFTKFIREKLKVTYYTVKKITDNDPDNFYYNTVAAKSCMSCHSIDQLFYRKYEDNQWKQKIDAAKKEGKLIVYMPLQFYPECSIDYWGTNQDFSDFYSVVSKIISNKYQNILILCKEHPSASALRKSAFYAQFSKNPNVLLTPFNALSNEVIEASDLVLTWTGSVGVEAVVRRKPLITLGEAYYDNGTFIKQLKDFEQLTSLEEIALEYFNSVEIKEVDVLDMLDFMLTGLVEGYVFPLDYETKTNPVNVERIKILANNISEKIEEVKKVGTYGVKSGCF